MNIFGLLIGIVSIAILILVLGNSFRRWNEGNAYSHEKESSSESLKTMGIGLILFVILGLLLGLCN